MRCVGLVGSAVWAVLTGTATAHLRGDGLGDVATGRAAPSDAQGLAGAKVAPGGCAQIQEFIVANQCGDEVVLRGWEEVVPAKSEVSIRSQRSTHLDRISWRLVDGPWDYDYIEMNWPFPGANSSFCSHPNYVTWFGFSTSSRYEALDPATRGLACADAGAEVALNTSTCPTQASDRFACDFQATPSSIMDCASDAARYQKARSWAINQDGSRTPHFACPTGGGEWCGVGVNFPCSPGSPNWPGDRVATWIDCVNRGLPIILKLTLCI